VAETGRGELITDAAADPRIVRHDDPALAVKSVIAVPLIFRDRFFGVLAVTNPADGLPFSATDFSLVQSLAEQAALALHNAEFLNFQIEKSQLDLDLSLASGIQKMLLPRIAPRIAGLDVDARYLAAQKIGGDLYDLFPLSAARLGVAVADVSGKGIPAALLVSTVHAAVHLQIDEAKTVAELIERIDRHLQKFSATHKFLTLFFGLLEPDSGLLRYVSAGHNPALVARNDGSVERVESTGVPIGMLPNATWREETITLAHGELIAVYTDGLTEAGNEKEEEFGMERLTRLVAASARKPVQALCDVILADVADFASGMPQYDDQTLLVVRRT
jgi:sigma-B regulation protein RsbU (phosphoserine phosphatase)